MPTYRVPVTAFGNVTVEADDEEAAREAAENYAHKHKDMVLEVVVDLAAELDRVDDAEDE